MPDGEVILSDCRNLCLKFLSDTFIVKESLQKLVSSIARLSLMGENLLNKELCIRHVPGRDNGVIQTAQSSQSALVWLNDYANKYATCTAKRR